jgi:hypothetical protein
MSGLDKYTDHQLLEELVRRANQGSPHDNPQSFCEDCSNFVIWAKKGEPPESYNPCRLKHYMNFKMPDGYEFTNYGHYRLVCSDRDIRSET